MQNIYLNLKIKMLHEIKKNLYFFQVSAVCIGICVYMHATFLVVEIVYRFQWAKFYTGNILLLTKNR